MNPNYLENFKSYYYSVQLGQAIPSTSLNLPEDIDLTTLQVSGLNTFNLEFLCKPISNNPSSIAVNDSVSPGRLEQIIAKVSASISYFGGGLNSQSTLPKFSHRYLYF
ncbi:MAG: hypothetical protein IMF12_10575 [Proteobacteria bacterium]|nr:hypothetical protein [Pseudomonadota bacterium]